MFERTPNTIKLGIVKGISCILETMKEVTKIYWRLIDHLVLINRGKEGDFVMMRICDRVCVPNAQEHNKNILEEG